MNISLDAGKRRMVARCAVLAACCIVLVSCSSSPIEDGDLPLLLTVEDLAEFGIEVQRFSDRQVMRRNRYFDGTMEIESEFETPDGSADQVFLSTTAGFERSPGDAQVAYRLLKGSIGVGTRIGGVTMRLVPDFYSWGDESFFGVLEGPHGPGGNVFGTRSGSKTYIVLIAGLYFDDADEWAAFVGPKLSYFQEYDPTRR